LEGITGETKIGMDCSVVPLKKNGLFLISTTDFFYPLVDDPYMQGKIGCANVLSDLYAMGIVDCDNVLMILASSLDMKERERYISTQQMIQGFNDLVTEAETECTGGQTVLNPWPIIGGSATSVCAEGEFIRPEHLQIGDVVILTKPLGTQVAVNVHQWMELNNHWWSKVNDLITPEQVNVAYTNAMNSMARLNRTGAKLMHKYQAHGATDVTGFGIIGHATNLAANQSSPMNIQLDCLPIYANMKTIDDRVQLFKLMNGFSAETSGGLLICLPADQAEGFIQEIQQIDGHPAWIIGSVVENNTNQPNHAYLSEQLQILEV